MSPSEEPSFADQASDLAAEFAEAIEENRLADIPDDSLGLLFANVVKVYGAKAQEGEPPLPFARNSGVTDVDVLISCLAVLEATGSLVFELGLWQSMTSVGRRKRSEAAVPADFK